MTDNNSQFRWLERKVVIDFGRLGVAHTGNIVKVLQYKAYKDGVDFDWQDIPTVKEGEV
jgi:hypothetical protein